MQDYHDRLINAKTLMEALHFGSWKAGELIREINQEVRLKEGKMTRAGWVLASRVAERYDISTEALIKAYLKLHKK